MKARRAYGFLLLVLLLSAGCASSRPATLTSLSGIWKGVWAVEKREPTPKGTLTRAVVSGELELKLVQAPDGAVTGAFVTATNLPDATGELKAANVSGNHITLISANGITMDAIRVGDRIRGKFQIVGASGTALQANMALRRDQ